MNPTAIDPQAALRALADNPASRLLDVREFPEWQAEHVARAILVPLSTFNLGQLGADRDAPLMVLCRTGNRARQAADRLSAAGYANVTVVEGGLEAWKTAGLPYERGASRVWSLERQVRFTAGALVFIGVLGWLFLSPWFLLLSAGVGFGLMFSAATDTCAMGMLLARMPWNRAPKPTLTPPSGKVAKMPTVTIGLIALSSGAGFVGALSGLGGGMFIVPALVLLAGLPMRLAIGASLLAVVATSAGASVAFVRDGWTNLRVAIVLECATVTGALLGAFMAGWISARALEALFVLMMLQAAWFSLRKRDATPLPNSDRLCARFALSGRMPAANGRSTPYGVAHLPGGAALMLVAGLMSGLLGIGAGAVKVIAMDQVMRLPLKVSSATSNFMIGVTAGAGAIVFLAHGDVAPMIAAPVALGVTVGAIAGSKLLPYANVHWLRMVFVVLLLAISIQMGWRVVMGA